MKFLRIFSIFLLFLLGCSSKADNIKMTKIPVDVMGFSFEIPEEWNKAQDIIIVPIQKSDNNGDYFEIAFYFMPDDAKKIRENLAKDNKLSLETLPQILAESYSLSRIVVCENSSSQFENLKTENWDKLKKIGKNEKYNILFCKADNSQGIDENYGEKYKQYFSIFDKIRKSVKTFTPKNPEQPGNPANSLSGKIDFQAEDLEGNAVNSLDLFKQNKITMVNVWGTYCNPCIKEMPELIELNDEYEDFAIVGIVIDANNNEETAISMVKKLKIDFTNLVPNSGMNDKVLRFISAVPTTFFVNRNSVVVGEIIVGADVEGYKRNIEKLLK